MALTTGTGTGLSDPAGEGDDRPSGPVAPSGAGLRRRSFLGSRRRQIGAGLLIAAAIAFLLVQGLDNATEYYQTVPQAVSHRAQLGTKQFRIMGTVGPDIVRRGAEIDFSITYDGVSTGVADSAQPSQLFKPGIPVVLEGHWTGNVFRSDLIMVKHSSNYTPPTDPAAHQPARS